MPPARRQLPWSRTCRAKVTGAELMDYVVPGQVIKLGAGAKVIIGYMKSCWRETISGMTAIVGAEESSVHCRVQSL